MNTFDLLVYSALALVAAYPFVSSGVAKLAGGIKLSPAAPTPNARDKWAHKWTGELLTLVDELTAHGDAEAAKLCRQLIWLIIGGEQQEKKK